MVGRRLLVLLVAVTIGHVLLISSQVQSRRGLPVIQEVSFGLFAGIQRATSALADGGTGIWRHYFALRGVAVENLAGFRKTMIRALIPPPAGFDINHWAANQVYIALGNFMTAAAVMGIDTCPMEGIEPAKYDEFLGIAAQGYGTVVACVAGYRAADDKYAVTPKVRFATEDVITEI